MNYYKIVPSFILALILSIGFIGCSSSDSQTSSAQDSTEISTIENPTTVTSAKATAQLGNLANAKVNIYEIQENGSLNLKWSEITFSGEKLEDIGKFNSHAYDMEDDRFYLVEIIGGDDWDSDDNGIIDETPTTNLGTIRAIAKGKDIIYAGNTFRVTIATELVYEDVLPILKYQFDEATFGNSLQNSITKVINDINQDGIVDINDILIFNPVNDTDKITLSYKERLEDFIATIHSGGIATEDTSVSIGSLYLHNSVQCIALTKDNTKAFLNQKDTNLTILDISNPANPKIVNKMDMGEFINHIVLNKDETRAYITKFSSETVTVVNIEDVSNPSIIAQFDTNGTAYDIAINDDETRAYVSVSNGCMEVLDISDLENVKSIETFSGDLKSSDNIILGKSNKKAYITILGLNSFYILDLKDDNISILASYRSDRELKKIIINDDETKAYLADENGMTIVDISNPENIIKLGSFSSFYAIPEDDSYERVYQTYNNYLEDIQYIAVNHEDSKAFISYKDIETGQNGIVSIDVTNPTNPTPIGVFYGNFNNLALSEDGMKLYAGKSSVENFFRLNTLMILDTNLLKTPAYITGTYHSLYSSNGVVLSKDETIAYLANRGSLDILDISDPSNPLYINYVPDIESNYITLNYEKTRAYVGTRENFQIYDLSNGRDITLINSIEDFYVNSILVNKDGTKAYIADGENRGFVILDISNENNITEINSLNDNLIIDFAINKDETKAILIDEEGDGLIIADINSSNSIVTKISSYTDILPTDIESNDDMSITYLTTLEKGFLILDTSDLYDIKEISAIPTSGCFSAITLNNDKTKAYITDMENYQLLVFDISDPYNPKLLKTYQTPPATIPYRVKLNKDETKAFISNIIKGLTIIDLNM